MTLWNQASSGAVFSPQVLKQTGQEMSYMDNEPRVDAASCKQAPGAFAPVIDRNRCEGKGDCVSVCPKNVFTLGVLPKSERDGLSWTGKVKGFAHGWKQAFMPNVAACEACGLCVSACPEDAIKLTRT